MDLNALQLLVEAAAAGSLSETARRTGIPLPTVSRQLRKLEDELERRLLERGPKGLALTPSGEQLVVDAEPALANLKQAEQRLRDVTGVAGRLRLSMPPHLEPLWEVFRAFGRKHPEVTYEIFVTDRRVDLVADGVDVALRVGEPGSSTYVGRTLARYRHRLVASKSFMAEHVLREPADLRNVPCASWRTGGGTVWKLGETNVRVEPVLVTNDYQHLLRLAQAGDVVTEVPPFLADSLLTAGELLEPLPEHPLPEVPMRALIVERRSLSPLIRQFLEFASVNVPRALLGSS